MMMKDRNAMYEDMRNERTRANEEMMNIRRGWGVDCSLADENVCIAIRKIRRGKAESHCF